MNIGIIGFGYMGEWHYHKILDEKDFTVTAVFDISEYSQNKARALGIYVYDTLDSLLNDLEINAVIVATPNSTHFHICKMALEHFKHVICEKPTLLDLNELQILFDLANDNNLIFTTHFNRRWDQDFLQIQEALGSNKIGMPKNIKLQCIGQRGVLYGWRSLDSEGGLLYDWGPHLVDQILLLNSEAVVTQITARVTSILTKTTNDFFTILLSFSNGRTAYIECGIFGLFNVPHWYIIGDNGTIVGNLNENITLSFIKDNLIDWNDNNIVESGKVSRLMAQMDAQYISTVTGEHIDRDQTEFYRDFNNAIKNKCSPSISQADIYRVMKILEVAKISSANKSTETVSI